MAHGREISTRVSGQPRLAPSPNSRNAASDLLRALGIHRVTRWIRGLTGYSQFDVMSGAEVGVMPHVGRHCAGGYGLCSVRRCGTPDRSVSTA